MMKLIYFWLFTGYSLFQPSIIQAKIELNFSQPPEQIEVSDSFEIEVNLSGISDGSSYYIRGVFFQEGSSQYFGYTQNNQGEWQNAPSQFETFYKISENGSYLISFKPDFTNAGFVGSGNYFFKIGRYTTGGSLTWTDSPAANIKIIAPPTPTQIDTTHTPTSTPSQVLKPTISMEQPPNNIRLSEIIACPATGAKEWVEIVNQNNQTANLQDWVITDDLSRTRLLFSTNLTAGQFFPIEINNPFLNNTGDTIFLINNQNQVVDQMSYDDCHAISSWIKHDNQWKETITITKGSDNVLKKTLSPTITSKPTATPKPSISATGKSEIEEFTSFEFNENLEHLEVNEDVQSSTFSASNSGIVLGVSEQAPEESSPSTVPTEKTETTDWDDLGLFLMIGGSLLLLGVGVFLSWEWYTKNS